MSFYLKQKKILFNLMLMSLIWLSTAFGNYLILLLVNTFDHVVIAGLSTSFAEVIGCFVGAVIYLKLGVKLSLFLTFSCSTIGGILVLVYGENHMDSPWFFLGVMMAKFGVTCNFTINLVATSYFFPTLFYATALGVCNFLARFISSFSFIIA